MAAFFMEIKKILNGINITGIDISKYGLKNSHPVIKKYLYHFVARKKLKFKNKQFDLVISFGTLHNFEIYDLQTSLKEISRVGKESYVWVESYRNYKELFNLECWALTCKAFYSKKEWLWIFKQNQFKGDYEFIYFN